MPFQIQGFGGTVAEVDGTTFRALRVTTRPVDYGSLGYYRMSQISGTMAAALAANAEMYQFRWTDATRLAVVFLIDISAGQNVAASAAAIVSFEAVIARAWTVDGSGGTAATITGNNGKLRTSMGTMLAGAMRISTTAGLTAGTKTLDTQGISNVAFGIGTGAITTSNSLIICPLRSLLDAGPPNMHPIVLAQNEGWIVKNGPVIFPAAMTWNFGVTHAWAEVASY